jgi:hypothetical protein
MSHDRVLLFSGSSIGLVVAGLEPMLALERSRWSAAPRRAMLIGSRAANFLKNGVLGRSITATTDWDLIASAHYVEKYLTDNAPRITSVSVYKYPLDPHEPSSGPYMLKIRVEISVELRDDETFQVVLGAAQRRDYVNSSDFVSQLPRLASTSDSILEFELPWTAHEHVALPSSGSQLLELVPLDRLRKCLVPGYTSHRAKPYTARIAPLQWLALIKESHIFHPIEWRKHIADIHALRAASARAGAPNALLVRFLEVCFALVGKPLGERVLKGVCCMGLGTAIRNQSTSRW